jgi:hypothetical protein
MRPFLLSIYSMFISPEKYVRSFIPLKEVLYYYKTSKALVFDDIIGLC